MGSRFVEKACHQALNAHETENVDYYDALHAAERIYTANWKAYRQKHGYWSERDEARTRMYKLPSGSARKIFDMDTDIQRILASRDPRLPVYRDMLAQILDAHTTSTSTPRFEPVLRTFLVFARMQKNQSQTEPQTSRGWSASFGDVHCVFPGRDTWAIWICLRNMWPMQ